MLNRPDDGSVFESQGSIGESVALVFIPIVPYLGFIDVIARIKFNGQPFGEPVGYGSPGEAEAGIRNFRGTSVARHPVIAFVKIDGGTMPVVGDGPQVVFAKNPNIHRCPHRTAGRAALGL